MQNCIVNLRPVPGGKLTLCSLLVAHGLFLLGLIRCWHRRRGKNPPDGILKFDARQSQILGGFRHEWIKSISKSFASQFCGAAIKFVVVTLYGKLLFVCGFIAKVFDHRPFTKSSTWPPTIPCGGGHSLLIQNRAKFNSLYLTPFGFQTGEPLLSESKNISNRISPSFVFEMPSKYRIEPIQPTTGIKEPKSSSECFPNWRKTDSCFFNSSSSDNGRAGFWYIGRKCRLAAKFVKGGFTSTRIRPKILWIGRLRGSALARFVTVCVICACNCALANSSEATLVSSVNDVSVEPMSPTTSNARPHNKILQYRFFNRSCLWYGRTIFSVLPSPHTPTMTMNAPIMPIEIQSHANDSKKDSITRILLSVYIIANALAVVSILAVFVWSFFPSRQSH